MHITTQLLQKLKPSVDKKWLQLSAGLIWLGVGLMLIKYAYEWIIPAGQNNWLLLVSVGLLLAWLIYSFGFSKLAKKNIKRINEMNGRKVCFFAFQRWTQYPLVAFMIFLGIYLRVYSPLPKSLLSILYLGIGGGLSAASIHYFLHIYHISKRSYKIYE